MKSALWLIVGIGLGFLAAHRLNRSAWGRAFFSDLDARTREFTDGIVDGYRSREAELRADGGAADAAPDSGPADDSAHADTAHADDTVR